MSTIVTAELQWQYSQTELIFWITLVSNTLSVIVESIYGVTQIL